MATSKNNDMYSYLDQLSTQELEDLLRKDMEAADGGDLDMVMYIMEVIEKREGGISAADKKAAAQALEDFFNNYATPEGKVLQLYPCDTLPNAACMQNEHKEKTHSFSARSIVLIAAVLICVFSLVACSTSGIERFFQMVGKWTSETFTFEEQSSENTSEHNNTSTQNNSPKDMSYKTIEDALIAYGITAKVVPSIPSDFAVVSVEAIQLNNEDTLLYSTYSNDTDQYITLQIIIHSMPESMTFEKDGTEVSEYTHNGTTYFLYNNNCSNCAAWYLGNLECAIDTNLSQEDIIYMIETA